LLLIQGPEMRLDVTAGHPVLIMFQRKMKEKARMFSPGECSKTVLDVVAAEVALDQVMKKAAPERKPSQPQWQKQRKLGELTQVLAGA